MSDDDIALDEKRIYEERREEAHAYVACEMGVATVALSDDQIGRFGLEHQCTARDIAADRGRLAVATAEDVLVGSDEGFESTEFGPATAVGVGERVVAASEDGTLARLDGDEWVTLGAVEEIHAVDGDLVAATDGCFRIDGDDLVALGGDAVRDVAAAGPYAGTADGVDRLADGWTTELAGDATVVSAERDGDRAHAVVDGDFFARASGEWTAVDPTVSGIVDVAYAAATVTVTDDGTVAIDPVTAKDGAPEWRSRALGLAGVTGVAVP
ncbi:hypothetical protein GOC74_04050 [Halomicrobium mukohataei]|uniref:HVO-0234-like beta-propeller domain-containing protein n=1 Tax=Halomicrobium mukohataei TaxID=57705 RepID=A0A847UCA3_9EURY|nr:hypothetical protein [Halomicrobium mukohataei]NLV09100.1 hypothetical protein [Halomicrobium mukohataei]